MYPHSINDQSERQVLSFPSMHNAYAEPFSGSQVPPTDDMGAQPSNRSNPSLKYSVDWNAFTIRFEYIEQLNIDVETVFDVIGLNPDDFQKMDRGRYGYTQAYVAHDITVLFNIPLDRQGIMVEMSGQGCRWFEKISTLLPEDHACREDVWLIMWAKLMEIGARHSRLDIAIDDKHGTEEQVDPYFTVEQVINHVRDKHWTSRFRGSSKNPAILVLEGFSQDEDGTKTVYFGTSQSRLRVRIYDKGKKEDFDGHWVRTELQMRDERADNAVAHFVGGLALGEIASGTLKNYLNFRQPTKNGKPSEDEDKSKWDLAPWWEKFLGDVEKVKLTTAKPEKTFDEIEEWFEKQMSTTLGMQLEVKGEQDFIKDLLRRAKVGIGKHTKRHLLLVSDALDELDKLREKTEETMNRVFLHPAPICGLTNEY